MRTNGFLLVVLCWLSLYGCGNGSSNQSQPTPVKFDISWAERSRATNAPASALSAILLLKGARPDHSDFTFAVNRNDAPASYTQTVTSTAPAAVGTWNATITFYANKDGQGAVVGVANKTVTLKPDGSGIGDIVTVGSVTSVLVGTGQTVIVGQNTDLLFTALDSGGNLLVMTPGSAQWNVLTGNDSLLHLTLSGTATGVAVGTATVTVTVDGKTSPTGSVAVMSGLTIPVLIAEAISTVSGPSVRLRWTANTFGNVAIQQAQLFRLPDFPAGSGGGGGGGGGSASTPIAVSTPTLTEMNDQPSPYFPYAAGVNLLSPGSNGCISTPLPPVDTGFQPGISYLYQLTAVALQTGGACTQTEIGVSGMATPIVPVVLTLPANNVTSVDLQQFAPTFTSRRGADVFQVEVSTDGTFKTKARIFLQQLFSTSPNVDDISQSVAQPIDLTTRPELLADTVFANFVNHVPNAPVPNLYWRVGGRHDADVPGPVHFISQAPGDPDRTFRWVYSAVFTFTPK